MEVLEGWEVRGVDGLEGGRLEALGGGVWVVNPESNQTDCCSFSLSLCCLFLTRIFVLYRACCFVN